MGKVTIVLGLFVFSFLAFGEGEYTPRITFEKEKKVEKEKRRTKEGKKK